MRKMKDSGIEWIGDIPESWDICPVKYNFDIVLGKMLQPVPKNDGDELCSYVCAVNVTWQGIDLSVEKQMWFSPKEREIYRLQCGDLVVTEGGDVAVSCIWNNELNECYFQNAVHRVRPHAGNSNRFLYYWMQVLKDSGYIDLICNKATLAHFTKDKFETCPMPRIDLALQNCIVAYLDEKCAEIDAIIAAKEKTNELLKERRQSIIYEAVTKGLDPTIPMKDSGIEWIGEIPENWGICPVKYNFDIVLGKMLQPAPKNEEDELRSYVCAVNVTWQGIDLNVEKQMWFSPKEREIYRLQCGDLLVTEGGDVAVSCPWNDELNECYFQNAIHRVRPRSGNSNRFLYYWMQVLKDSGYIDLICNKATLAHFTKDKFETCPMPRIDLALQNCIVEYLDKKCAEIDALIATNNSTIEKMKEYRQSIIYEVVTGKVEV